jgi:hypothetical protein
VAHLAVQHNLEGARLGDGAFTLLGLIHGEITHGCALDEDGVLEGARSYSSYESADKREVAHTCNPSYSGHIGRRIKV